MSSGRLPRTAHPELFAWSDALDPADYLIARYRVGSILSAEATALGMAMEQSTTTVRIAGFVEPDSLRHATIRVRNIEPAGDAPSGGPENFSLDTEAYGSGDHTARLWRIELAIPYANLLGRPAQLANVVIGELPRLGFISSLQLEQCRLPAHFGPGPGFGVAGIRARLGVASSPVLCRSMRPAVGLDTETMFRLNREVLANGVHMVKDDELMCFVDNDAFRRHVVRMLAARDEAAQRSGERKAYLATLLCEADELSERWEIACALGVDAVLIAPHIQGFGTLASIARQKVMPVLAHNSYGEMVSRHPHWGIADAVVSGWTERCGADWYVTPGQFAEAGHAAQIGAVDASAAAGLQAMPIIQGGKNPAGMSHYRRAFGGNDFMLIVASYIDGHPQGIAAGARAMREAVDAV